MSTNHLHVDHTTFCFLHLHLEGTDAPKGLLAWIIGPLVFRHVGFINVWLLHFQVEGISLGMGIQCKMIGFIGDLLL